MESSTKIPPTVRIRLHPISPAIPPFSPFSNAGVAVSDVLIYMHRHCTEHGGVEVIQPNIDFYNTVEFRVYADLVLRTGEIVPMAFSNEHGEYPVFYLEPMVPPEQRGMLSLSDHAT